MNLSYLLTAEHKAMLSSYGRSVLAAVVAVSATGNYSPDDILKAVLAALLPVLIRYANPNDASFGRVKEVVKPVKVSKSKNSKKSA
jgi:hypothetical protein